MFTKVFYPLPLIDAPRREGGCVISIKKIHQGPEGGIISKLLKLEGGGGGGLAISRGTFFAASLMIPVIKGVLRVIRTKIWK